MGTSLALGKAMGQPLLALGAIWEVIRCSDGAPSAHRVSSRSLTCIPFFSKLNTRTPLLLPPVALTALAAPSSGAVTLKRVQPFSACTGVWNLPNFSVPAQLSFCPTLVSEVGHLAPAAPHDLAMAHRLAGTLAASPCDAPTPQTTSGASTASCAATPLSLIN